MDMNDILGYLEHAPLYEVYRLRSAMDVMFEDPIRLGMLRERLIPGQDVTYFNWEENRLIRVQILEVKRTRVVVRETETQQRYTIPMFWINIDDAENPVLRHNSDLGIPRNQLRVGDQVGFRDRNNVTKTGEVIRLNPKTATIRVSPHSTWRVGYGFLFDILDGEPAHTKLVSNVDVIDATLLDETS